MTFPEDVDSVLGELRTMLIEKNAGYGNSALEPIRIFSKADNLEQIRVRIDDKLSRIMRGNGVIKEDTIFDLMGYLVLMRVAQRQERAAVRIEAEIPGHGRIVPQEMGKIPDALKGLAKEAMEKHNHVHVEPVMVGVPQSPGSHEAKKPEPLNLTKADLTIPKFPHDKKLEKSYKTLFYLEMPDGRVVLKYMSNLLHTTKTLISKLLYPMPNCYLEKSGLTANNVTGIKIYQEYLFVSKISENAKKNTAKSEDPDKWRYKKMGLNDTHVGTEDFEKVEGDLE